MASELITTLSDKYFIRAKNLFEGEYGYDFAPSETIFMNSIFILNIASAIQTKFDEEGGRLESVMEYKAVINKQGVDWLVSCLFAARNAGATWSNLVVTRLLKRIFGRLLLLGGITTLFFIIGLALFNYQQTSKPDKLLEAKREYSQKHFERAADLFRSLANHGNAYAQYALGNMYKEGQGVTQDYKEASNLYRLAAEQGDTYGQISLGNMYTKGQGVTQDFGEAVKWFRLAAEKGNATAQYNLGLMYLGKKGVTQDFDEAVKWFRLAAEKGYSKAQSHLGDMYWVGLGVTQDVKEAINWYQLAAKKDHADIQNNPTNVIENGQGTLASSDGRRYEGEFKDGKIAGHGVLTWSSGNRYEGEFKDNSFNGHGKLTLLDGRRYEGEFKDGSLNGHGSYSSPNGVKYEGEYLNGLANGFGTLTDATGTVYNATFTNGCAHSESERMNLVFDTTAEKCGF